jgi:hypothetical protein
MLTGWVLIAVFFNVSPKALSHDGLLPMAAATSAVFADQKACQQTANVLTGEFHWQLYVVCEPQSLKSGLTYGTNPTLQ